MANPIQPSAASQQALATAGQAAGDDAAAQQQLATDQKNLVSLQAQVVQDQKTAGTADAASNAAFIAACQSLATDFGVPLPVTIPAVQQAPATPPTGS